MQKFENVDILACLDTVMKQNTGFYQSDFEIDKEIIHKAAASPDREDRTLLWLSRPSGTHCFRERDVNRLFSLLPYKTLTFSKIEGRHGIYALIDKNENRDRDIRKPRPSIRAQLAADKKKAAPKWAAKTKHHEMEV